MSPDSMKERFIGWARRGRNLRSTVYVHIRGCEVIKVRADRVSTGSRYARSSYLRRQSGSVIAPTSTCIWLVSLRLSHFSGRTSRPGGGREPSPIILLICWCRAARERGSRRGHTKTLSSPSKRCKPRLGKRIIILVTIKMSALAPLQRARERPHAMGLAGPYTRVAASPRDADENILSAQSRKADLYYLHCSRARTRAGPVEVHVL